MFLSKTWLIISSGRFSDDLKFDRMFTETLSFFISNFYSKQPWTSNLVLFFVVELFSNQRLWNSQNLNPNLHSMINMMKAPSTTMKNIWFWQLVQINSTGNLKLKDIWFAINYESWRFIAASENISKCTRVSYLLWSGLSGENVYFLS